MLKNLDRYHIKLASKSPRRHYLLKQLGVDFDILTSNEVDESYPPELKNGEIVEYLSLHKAKHYANEIGKQDLLITADTIVVNNEIVLNKPADEQEAFEMLNSISGKAHDVLTGVCLMTLQKHRTFHAKTSVYFKKLAKEEILHYIEHYQPFDKAGSYGIQEWIGYIGVEKIEGSYFNVMGLPVQKLYEELKNF